MIPTLWIFIIAIDTVVFPLLARTLSIIALAVGYEPMLRWEMQSSVRKKKILIKPQDVWFDVPLNSPPLPTLCCACQ